VEVSWDSRRPRPSGEGGRQLGLGEGGGPREEGGVGRPKAKAQAARPETGDGSKLKKKFFSNFN
jgi:hypothetical protein